MTQHLKVRNISCTKSKSNHMNSRLTQQIITTTIRQIKSPFLAALQRCYTDVISQTQFNTEIYSVC